MGLGWGQQLLVAEIEDLKNTDAEIIMIRPLKLLLDAISRLHCEETGLAHHETTRGVLWTFHLIQSQILYLYVETTDNCTSQYVISTTGVVCVAVL